MSRILALVVVLVSFVPVAASAEEPIRVVDDTLVIPDDVDPAQALESVVDIARIFELYEPVIPWIPGVNIDLRKEVVSAAAPCVLDLPVSGNAIGKAINEKARVLATSEPAACSPDGRLDGRRILLDFSASTYNIGRRIDRIEITACPGVTANGDRVIHAVGRMYAGYKPEDPALNPVTEAVGARALQGAFIRQVSAVLDAVQLHWRDL